jgi:hypothetical protein
MLCERLLVVGWWLVLSSAVAARVVRGGPTQTALQQERAVQEVEDASGSGNHGSQDGDDSDRLPRLLLYTSVLGGDAAWERAKMLPLFLWSARKAPDVDILLIGNGELYARRRTCPLLNVEALRKLS